MMQFRDDEHKAAYNDLMQRMAAEEWSCYGNWDISEPVFAIIRQNKNTKWETDTFAVNYQAEAIGKISGGSTLDRIEFHLYDNTPDFGDTPQWFTEVGWCIPGENVIGTKADLYIKNDTDEDSFAADIFGGARAFDSTVSNRTSGGIRYSTIVNSASAFKYGVGSNLPETQITNSFNNAKLYPGASSLIFTGASTPRRGADDLEGLYFAVPLPSGPGAVEYDAKTSFTVHFDDSAAYITDLAGNRLRSKTISTIDRTPPSIDMTICPVGADEVEMVFVKELITDSRDINYITNPTTLDNITIDEEFEYLISQVLNIITIAADGSPQEVAADDLKFDTSVPAKVWVTNNSIGSAFTHIKLKLSRPVTLQDIQEKYIRIGYVPKYGETSVDLFTQKDGSRVTFIQDENGNTIQMYTAHAFSDFAVDVIKPLYAYDSALTEDDGTIISNGVWHTDLSDDVDVSSWAVHEWNRDQKNYGTLPAGHTVAVVADTGDAAYVNIYLANAPDDKSVSSQANKDFEFDPSWRIWLPNVTNDVFTAVSEKNNTT